MDHPRNIPEGYHSVQPYLMFENCIEAIAYFAIVFQAKEKFIVKSAEGRVVHAEIVIGDSVLMLADENPDMQAFASAHYGGSPISLMVYVEDCDATHACAIRGGAASLREPTDTPHGDRLAGFLDPFGYKWWVAHRIAPEG